VKRIIPESVFADIDLSQKPKNIGLI